MTKNSQQPREIFLRAECPHPSCGATVIVSVPSNIRETTIQTYCPRCAARIVVPIMGNFDGNTEREIGVDTYTIHVSGEVASEVETVTKSLIKEMEMSKNKKNLSIHNPWISGSFYLAGAVIIGTLLLVIAKNVNVVVLPIVIIGTLLLISIVGAFQLRQDSSLSQKNFLSLMLMTFRQIPFIRPKDEKPQNKK